MGLQKFFDKYDTVIFDLDGVITSEQSYWNSAALAVFEYLKLNCGEQIDVEECNKNFKNIRKHIFLNDELIEVLKSKGVNSNWDLAYVTVLLTWICNGKENWDNFEAVLEYAKKMSENILDEYDRLALECSEKVGFDYEWLKRNELMWTTLRDIFQTWFLGDELFEKQYGYKPVNSGKTGLLYNEEPIIDKDILVKILKLLSENKRLCTATGRPKDEMETPLKSWDVLRYFSKNGLCNFDDVIEAEKEIEGGTFTKPHPYMFLKALYGTDYSNKKIIDGDYDKSKIQKTLVVGDAGADILGARAMGADFCATLTGVSGEAARTYFEKLGAEYIVGSVEEFLTEEE